MKASERRLLLILGLLALLCGTAVLVQRLLVLQRSTARRVQSLELRQTESRAMLAEAGLWKARLEWLKQHQPPMVSENQASEELLEAMLSLANKYHLAVQKKQLHEVSGLSFYRQVGVTLTVQGDLPDVFRWMHALLTPESFRLVSQLKILPDAKDPSKVVVIVRIDRRHAPAASAIDSTRGVVGLCCARPSSSLGSAAALGARQQMRHPSSSSVPGASGRLLHTILSPSCLHSLGAPFSPPPMLQVVNS